MKSKNKPTLLKELTLGEAIDIFLWFWRKYKLDANIVMVSNAEVVLDALVEASLSNIKSTLLKETFSVTNDRDVVFTMESVSVENWD